MASGIFCWAFLKHFDQQAGDFVRAIWAAQDLLAGRNPYARPFQLYPLTAAVFAFPFLRLALPVAGGIFYGLSSGLLAFGISQQGYHRLLVFLAYPYWSGLMTAQWPTLILASAFLPLLLPACLAKPQVGLPVFLTRASRWGLAASAALLAVSLALMPTWPLAWIHNFANYPRYFPLFVIPGPLIALALLRRRDPDARFLLLCAIMPERYFYDAFTLWCIPKSRRETVWTVFFSWIPGIWRWHYFPHSYEQIGVWEVLFMYFPMLVVILLRPDSGGRRAKKEKIESAERSSAATAAELHG